ncbi:MAG: formylglycine-generating enzyme family protein [Mesorhizobium sp.]|uniref:SUMF1/EgtB/PvdO family nonheme iron enzyme n=1 Tax=Mesorhizobium sp. TaxID=1871066 RepID=UPI000FE46521|nr:SUMF1/EgtB/PvdO family nonheme iron enzyme [Mesorhizobium sp.]RWG22879.1 MAG: formylglycine-generating enzyme family protein [Mesorhizobium sp.]
MSFDPVFTFGVVGAAALIGLGVSQAIDGASLQLGDSMAPSGLVVLEPGAFKHPLPGEFLKNGHPAPGPVLEEILHAPLEIMKFQVTTLDYERCVADGACKPADSGLPSDVPVTGVSHFDAEAFANWLSSRTGEAWRLPTDAEWAYAAGERFRGDIEAGEADPANPAKRWLKHYRNEATLGRKPDPEPRARGAFGLNSKGVADIAGNIWEWTSTCYTHTSISSDGASIGSSVDNCGVHVVEGFHRTYMSNFIRDGKSGDCAVGTPPDNLGFRLVRDRRGFLQAALHRLGLT